MPWKVYADGNQFCVHKQNADGSKGEKVACHPSKEKADAQLRALYANYHEADEGHGGYRGNKYEGPGKSEAISKLKAMYKAENMEIPGEKTEEAAKPAPKQEEPKKQDEPEKKDNPEEERAEGGEQSMNQPTTHDHEHMHGSFQHSHPHQHDKEHGIDGKFGKHEHPHAAEEAVDTSSMPELTRADMKKMTCSACKEQFEMTEADMEKCPKCGAPLGKKESVRTLVFGEIASLREAEIDKARRTIGVTLIRPGWSVNGRYYSKEMLASAVPVFEGTKCYIDHPTLDEDRNRPERSVADIAGYYRNVKQADDGRLTAQLVLVGKRGEEMFPLIVEASTNKPDLIGLSINAMGDTAMGEAEGRQGVIVKSLAKAFGTDIVTTASAGGRFEKLMQSGDEMTTALLQSLSYDEWRQVNSDFVARMKKEMRTARKEELESAALKEAAAKDTVIQEQTAQIEQLKESVKGLETKLADQERESATRVSEATADLKLLESGLPEEWRKSLRPQLIAEPDKMDVLVEAERTKYFAVKQPVVVTNAGVSDAMPTPVDPGLQAVAEALRTDASVYPLDDESPEEYAQRKKKLTRR